MVSLNEKRFRPSAAVEVADLPDGVRVLKQRVRGEYLVLTPEQQRVLALFDGRQTVHEVLQGLLQGESHPKLRAFYDVVLAAQAKGFLYEGDSEPPSAAATGRRWKVRCSPTSAVALALGLIGAGAFAVGVSAVPMLPGNPIGWCVALAAISLGLSLASLLAGAVLSGLGREIYRPELRLDMVLPFFSVDTRDALMGGRTVEALTAVQMLAAPFAVALVGWALDSNAILLAGWITALGLSSPFGNSPAHALLHALFRKQPELPRCADTFLHQKLLVQLLNFRESLTEERYFLIHSTWAVLWLGAVFRFASEQMARQANFIFEPGAPTVIFLLALVLAAPLAYGLWLIGKAGHRLFAPKFSTAETKLKPGGDGVRRPGPDETVKFLSDTLLFSQLAGTEIRAVAEAMDFLTVKPGTLIIRERDRGDLMFVIHNGRVEVRKEDEAGVSRPVAQLARGDVFGEIALLRQLPRNSSVVALEGTELFSLKKADFDRLLLSTLGAQKIQEVVQVCAFLRRNAIFSDWPPYALMKVAGQFTFQDSAAGATVIAERQPNEFFYLVYEGEFEVRKAGARVATLGPGDFFGEVSLLQGTVASADVVAVRNSRCLKLGRDSFLQLVSRDFTTGMAIERASERRVSALKKKGAAR